MVTQTVTLCVAWLRPRSTRRDRERDLVAATRALFDERGLQDAPDGGDRPRRRDQQGAHLPGVLVQGGALRPHGHPLPGRIARGRARAARGPARRARPLHPLLPALPGVPGLRAVADAPARGRAARARRRGHLAAARRLDVGLPGAARADPRRRGRRGPGLHGQPPLHAGARHDAPRAHRPRGRRGGAGRARRLPAGRRARAPGLCERCTHARPRGPYRR